MQEEPLRRPRSMTIIGWIGVLWGAVALPVGVVALFYFFTMPEWFTEWLRGRVAPEYLSALEKDNAYRMWAIWRTAIQMGLTVLLFVGSIHLLRLRPLGWQLMMVYVVLAFLWAGADRFAFESTYARFREAHALPPQARPGIRLTPGLLYPAVASFFLTRPKVAEAYRQHWFTRED
ncbi:MAG: hypothetical protein RMK45_08780 [Armatimonadota bacterium]|nr:hypothetical protein [Armatimonadota bacterium]